MNTYSVHESDGAIKASVTDEFRRKNPQMFAGQMPEAMIGRPSELESQPPGLPFALNLLRNDLEQLFTDTCELRERLRSIMIERVQPDEKQPPAPTPFPVCKVATQVLETHEIVRRLRKLVELTLVELDV